MKKVCISLVLCASYLFGMESAPKRIRVEETVPQQLQIFLQSGEERNYPISAQAGFFSEYIYGILDTFATQQGLEGSIEIPTHLSNTLASVIAQIFTNLVPLMQAQKNELQKPLDQQNRTNFITRPDGKFIMKNLQPMVNAAIINYNPQQILQFIVELTRGDGQNPPALDFLNTPYNLVHAFIRVYVEKILAQRPQLRIDQLINSVRLPESNRLFEQYYYFIKSGVQDELDVADYVAMNGMPNIIFKSVDLPSGEEQLKSLDLENKNITSLEGLDSIRDITTIQFVRASKNHISYIPADFKITQIVPRLRVLGLAHNKLSYIPAGLFTFPNNILLLDFSSNQLTTLPSNIFTGLVALQVLVLDKNQLTTLPADIFTGLTALQWLALANNQLKTLPANIFTGLILQELILNKNQLTTLPSNIFTGLTALQVLALNHNQLTTLPSDIFTGLTALQQLVLNHNQLTTLPSNIFTGLTALQVLALGYNQLAILPSDIFTGLTALQQLGLNHNQLTTLPSNIFTGLTALQVLWLNNNQLATLPSDIFTGLTALQGLALRYNQLTTLPSNIFTGLTALRELGLNNNQLTTLPSNIFTGLTALQQLLLRNNQLATLPSNIFNGLTALQQLGLDNNQLKTLPANIFTGLTALQGLGLDNNQLTTLPADIFTGLTALQGLGLRNNQLTAQLDPAIFVNVQQLFALYIEQNNFALTEQQFRQQYLNRPLPNNFHLSYDPQK